MSKKLTRKNRYIGFKSLNALLNKHLDIECLDVNNIEKRQRHLIEARAQWYYFIYKYSDWSYQKIANKFSKNHASILNALSKYNDTYVVWSPELRDTHELVTKLLEEKSKKIKEYLRKRAQRENKNIRFTSDPDFIVGRQRMLIAKLMQDNIQLRGQIAKYRTNKQMSNGGIRQALSADI